MKELEAQRINLIEEINRNMDEMKENEDKLLFQLTSTKGSLLEDVSLITVLNDLKKKSNESRAKISSAQDTEIKINAAREEYRPVATRGSILYFLLTDMGSVNSMYQTALHQFLKLFLESMTKYVYLPL